MLLLHVIGLALLASKQVAGLPAENFHLSVPSDSIPADDHIAKRATIPNGVTCGSKELLSTQQPPLTTCVASSDQDGVQRYTKDEIKKAVEWAKRSFPDKEGQCGSCL